MFNIEIHNIITMACNINLPTLLPWKSPVLTHQYYYHLSLEVSFILEKKQNTKLKTSFKIYEVHTISFQTFFVWALLLIVHTWNTCPFRNNFFRLLCTCCTILTSSERPHEIYQLWQSGFSRVYSNSCCSCSFESVIKKKLVSHLIRCIAITYWIFKSLRQF